MKVAVQLELDNEKKQSENYKLLEELKPYKYLEERLYKIFGEESTFSLADVIDTLEMELSEPNKKHPVNARILTYEEADKWEEYKDLEEQGLLVKLPCKVGDTVYVPTRNFISELRITLVSIDTSDGTMYFSWMLNTGIYPNLDGFSVYELGKTVFLTRKEAEKKLEEIKNDRDDKRNITNIRWRRSSNFYLHTNLCSNQQIQQMAKEWLQNQVSLQTA